MATHFFAVSDIEMGRRDIMDDFSDDDLFVQFTQHILEKTAGEEAFLVLNGDIFDFLKMDYKGEHVRYITEEISMWKLEQMMAAHHKVFEALRVFVNRHQHHLFFIIGNHDADLIWPRIQDWLRAFLGRPERVHFAHSFDYKDMHVEHGNLLDPFFHSDLKKPFVTYKGQKILNLPVGCYLVFSHLAPFKRRFPKEEQFFPRGKIAHYDGAYHDEIKKMFWKNIARAIVDPIIHFSDPTYRIDYIPFLRHVAEFGFEFIDDERFMPSRVRQIAKKYPQQKIFVLGHSHVLSQIEHRGRQFYFTDTWRDEYNILLENRPKKEKSYAEIVYDGGLKSAQLHLYQPSYEREHRPLLQKKHLQGKKLLVGF